MDTLQMGGGGGGIQKKKEIDVGDRKKEMDPALFKGASLILYESWIPVEDVDLSVRFC